MNRLFIWENRSLQSGLLCLLISIALAEEDKPSESPVALGTGLIIDTINREVLMDATVCLNRGLLEFITCRPGERQSFQHESIFSSSVTPSLVHAGLLGIGLEPHTLQPFENLEEVLSTKPARVTVEVEFEREGVVVRQLLSEWMHNLEKPNDPMPDFWVFTGSTFVDDNGVQRYAADVLGHTIGLTARGYGVVQYGERVSGNVQPQPGRSPTEGVTIKSRNVPEVRTKVRLVFSPYRGANAKKVEPPTKPAP